MRPGGRRVQGSGGSARRQRDPCDAEPKVDRSLRPSDPAGSHRLGLSQSRGILNVPGPKSNHLVADWVRSSKSLPHTGLIVRGEPKPAR